MTETASLSETEPELDEFDINTFAKYPGVSSSVVAFANVDTEYLGDIKLVCWLSSINWAPIPLALPVGFKKN